MAELDETLNRRVTATGCDSRTYIEFLEQGGSSREWERLAEQLTIGETCFFRNNGQYLFLRDVVLPELLGRERSLRCLSAGCATGDEAYSLAIVLREAMLFPHQAAIDAFDINPAAIRRAECGFVREWALRETPQEVRDRWFSPRGREFLVHGDIRKAVRFTLGNLIGKGEPWLNGAYDVIFCRNVIMYFGTDIQRLVLDRLAEALVPGGYLFLGHAESPRWLSDAFEPIHSHGAFCYRRKSAAGGPRRRIGRLRPEPARPVEEGPDPARSWFTDIEQAGQRIRKLAESIPSRPTGLQSSSCDLDAIVGLLQQERFAAALEALRRLPAKTRQQPTVRLLETVLLINRGEFEAAARISRALISDKLLAAEAHHALAVCLEASNEHPSAERHYASSVAADAAFAMPRLHLGLLARRQGNARAARPHLRSALALLRTEAADRVMLFGSGFGREALVSLCQAEMHASEART